MKVLLTDIETSPHLVHAWGIWDQNIGLNQIQKAGGILCWAAKWHGPKEKMHFSSVQNQSPKKMLVGIHKLLDEADVVVSYNGKRFDIPWLNGQFIEHGLLPPSPFKQVDLLETAKKQFRLPSNKLEYVSKVLGIGAKMPHEGHTLWTKVMAGEKAAWKRMEQYNKHDVVLLEQAYDKMRPWIRSHPNHGTYSEAGIELCPNCGSGHVQHRGWARTQVNKYRRLQCMDCGTWSRSGYTEFNQEDRKHILRPDLG